MAQPNYTMPEYMVNPGGNIAATIQRSRALSDQEAAQKFAQQQDAARLQMETGLNSLRQQQMEQVIQGAANRLVAQKKYNDLIAQGAEPYSAAVQSGMVMPRIPTGPPKVSSVTVDGREIPFVSDPMGRVHFPPSAAVKAPPEMPTTSSITMPDGTQVPYISDPRGVPHFVPSSITNPKATIPKSYVAPGQGIVERQPDGSWKNVFAFDPKSKLSEAEQAQKWALKENVRMAQARLKDARGTGADAEKAAQIEVDSALGNLQKWSQGIDSRGAKPQPQPAATNANPYKVGAVYSGMKYMGGDPNVEANWQKIK